MTMPELCVLDFFQSLGATLELAPAAEAMGYRRYWLAEHQPQPSPTLAVGLVAGVTEHIRVGTAAVLLGFRTPVLTAFDFHLLEAAFPGRIDAGFCAGLAAPKGLMAELFDGRTPVEGGYERRVASFIHHLRAQPADDPTQDPVAWPGATYAAPEIWVHGTGRGSAACAAQHGIALGFSLFHPLSNDDPAIIEDYRARFTVRGALGRPCVAVAVAGVCAESEERAQALVAEMDAPFIRPTLVGTASRWREGFERLQERFRPDAIVVLDMCRSLEHRRDSLMRIAEVAGIGQR